MVNFFIVCIVNGILFGIMDGLINGNPYGIKMMESYHPIAKTSINVPAGIIIDIVYGLCMGIIFLMLYSALPGDTGIIKGVSFGLLAWFFRVLMNTISSWMMFKIPAKTLIYCAVTGLAEMIITGIVYGIFLQRF